MKKILVFRIGALGDILMTTPFLRQLRKNNPDAKIDFLTSKSFVSAIKRNENVDGIIAFDSKIYFNKKIPEFQKLSKKIKSRKYDEIFILDKHWAFALSGFLFGIKKRYGFFRLNKKNYFLTKGINYDHSKHEIIHYFRLLKAAGYEVDFKDTSTELKLKSDDEKLANDIYRKTNKKVVCVAPGGGNNEGQIADIKIWPVEKFARLIEELNKRKYHIILIGGPTDKIKSEVIKELIHDQVDYTDLIGKTSIYETAAIIKKANYFIACDSGPMHIGTTVNKNIIGLYGPTSPKSFGPLNKDSKIIWKEKRPCYDEYGSFNTCKVNMMDKIEVDDVLKLIK